MRQRRHVATLALLALLPLGACSEEDDPPVSDPSPSTSDSPTPTAEPAPHEPTEPPVPEAISKANKAGARAFVEYYWALVTYAQLSGDTTPLEAIAMSGCRACKSGSSLIAELHAVGGTIEGGSRRVAQFEAVKVVRGTTKDFYEVDHLLDVDAHKVIPQASARPTPYGQSPREWWGLRDHGEAA